MPNFGAPQTFNSPATGFSGGNAAVERRGPVTYRYSGGETPSTPDLGARNQPGINAMASGGPNPSVSNNRMNDGGTVVFRSRSSPSGTVNPDLTGRIGGTIYDSRWRSGDNASAQSNVSAQTPVRDHGLIYSSSGRSPERSSSIGGPIAGPAATGGTRSSSVGGDRQALESRLADNQRSSLQARDRPSISARSEAAWTATGNTAGRRTNAEQVRAAGSELRTGARSLDSRLRQYTNASARTDTFDRGFIRARSTVVYHDRPDLIGHGPRYSYIYRDGHDRLFSRIIWPGYSYPVYYAFGSGYYAQWVYPYYHRKYLFVGLGDFYSWPWDYPYLRYYWYGAYPNVWYGYYPTPYEVETPGGNSYYTYNTYYSNPADYGDTTGYQASSNTLPYGVDNGTYAAIQALIQKQKAGEPPAATQSDTKFEAGVESFAAGHYAAATTAFADAMKLAPEDKILPFAYAQALFADGQYTEAAQVLRGALHNISPQKEGVFYPRGLYANDDVLFNEIDQLLNKVQEYGFDGDLQLLLGYQLMGIGEVEYARQPLEEANHDMVNAGAAKVLIGLLDKMDKVALSQTPTTGQTQNEQSSTAKSSLMEKVKSLDLKATQPQPEPQAQPKTDVNQSSGSQIVPNVVVPGKSESNEPNKEPNSVPISFDQEATHGGSATPVQPEPRLVAEAALIQPMAGWTAPADERLMAATIASLLAGGAMCLRRANQLAPPERIG